MILVQCIYQISEQQFSRVLVGSRNSGISLAIHRFAIGAKVAFQDILERRNKYQESDEHWLVSVYW